MITPNDDQVKQIYGLLALFKQTWVIVLGPIASAIWGYKLYRDARNRQKSLDERDAHDKEARDIMSRMDARTAALFDRLEKENLELREQKEKLEEDCARANRLLRTWFNLAHDRWAAWYSVYSTACIHMVEAHAEMLPKSMIPTRLSTDINKPWQKVKESEDDT